MKLQSILLPQYKFRQNLFDHQIIYAPKLDYEPGNGIIIPNTETGVCEKTVLIQIRLSDLGLHC